MKKSHVILLVALLFVGCSSIPKDGAHIVHKKDGSYLLYVDGVETYIKGVGGTNRIDLAAENGANAFRTWGGDIESIGRNVDLANSNNMFIMQGISLSKDPKSYVDSEYKGKLKAEVQAIVETYKDDKNILIWGLGNEIELGGRNNSATSWGFIEELAQLIKSIDKRHLVSTVITHNQEALDSIAKYAPSLDLIGINSYGSIGKVKDIVDNSSYSGPYMITEWGPTGWWETKKTEWGAPIEQTSEEKRVVYEQRYNDNILRRDKCLGSFVFLWGQKQERTPTWFSMFVENKVDGLPLNGEKTPMVEAMERVWKQTTLLQTAPIISQFTINDIKGVDSPFVKSGVEFEGVVEVSDKEDDRLTYVWEILKEATVLGDGGSYEPRPNRVGEVNISDINSYSTIINEVGEYRLFVYVLDNTGFVSTANTPFKVVNN